MVKKILLLVAFLVWISVICSACKGDVVTKFPHDGGLELTYSISGERGTSSILTVETLDGSYTSGLGKVIWYYDVSEGSSEYVVVIYYSSGYIYELHMHLHESKNPGDDVDYRIIEN